MSDWGLAWRADWLDWLVAMRDTDISDTLRLIGLGEILVDDNSFQILPSLYLVVFLNDFVIATNKKR